MTCLAAAWQAKRLIDFGSFHRGGDRKRHHFG